MEQNIAQKLRNRIKIHEGLRLTPYQDTRGNWTIGYGRNLTANRISESEAEILLGNDIINASAELYRFLPWIQQLDDPRKCAFIELSFNMGIEHLLTFRKMLEAAKAHDWNAAAHELLSSEWAKQVGNNRAHDIAYTIELGVI